MYRITDEQVPAIQIAMRDYIAEMKISKGLTVGPPRVKALMEGIARGKRTLSGMDTVYVGRSLLASKTDEDRELYATILETRIK